MTTPLAHLRALATGAALAGLGLGAWPTDARASTAALGPTVDWTEVPDHVVGPAVPFAAEAGPHTIFVNFDGVTLTEGYPDNARENVTSLTGMDGTYVPFGAAPDDPIRKLILDEVRLDYAGMWVEVTDERPADGQYTMIVVSPTGTMPGKAGVASLNCGGSPLGVGFAFFSAGSGSVDMIATTISHEAGHTFGIEHVENADDIMYWTTSGTHAAFVDACMPVDGATPACATFHETQCPPGQTNTYRELVELFGEAAAPDGGGPQVTLVAPTESERFAIGEQIVIIAEADDDVSVSQVKLHVDGELAGTKLAGPYEWTASDLAEGLHEIAVVARDTAGNETKSTAVTIAVGDVALPEPTPDADEPSEPIDPDAAFGLESPEAGCACTTQRGDAPRPAPLAVVAGLVAIGCRIRRQGAR